jgi:hypothetical protein
MHVGKNSEVSMKPLVTGCFDAAVPDARSAGDKVTPLKSEAQSQEYLPKPAKKGE